MDQCILVVEVDTSNRAFLRMAMEDEGYEVIDVVNGQQALQVLESTAVNLIILDMWLPVMDGIGFLNAYNATGGKVPIIGLCTSGRTERMARSLGVRDFLIKPIDLDMLLDSVKRCIT